MSLHASSLQATGTGLIPRTTSATPKNYASTISKITHSFARFKLQLCVYSHVIHNLIFPYRLWLYIQQPCHHKPYQLELSPHLDTPTVSNFFHWHLRPRQRDWALHDYGTHTKLRHRSTRRSVPHNLSRLHGIEPPTSERIDYTMDWQPLAPSQQ